MTLREQDVEAKDGYNVVLSIDSVIQHIVETALAEAMEKHSPISVSGIVVRPRTGEILALATLPNYDPNDVGHARPEAMRNRVIADSAEPGSTFKIVVVSGALNDGLVRLTDCFDCEHGLWYYAGRKLRDHEPYDVLSVEQIITHSSNIGAAKIGLKLGEDRLYEYIRNYGFGQNTDLPLQAEAPGIVHKVKNWTKVSIAQIPMGQGIAVTRLQMTMAMCAISAVATVSPFSTLAIRYILFFAFNYRPPGASQGLAGKIPAAPPFVCTPESNPRLYSDHPSRSPDQCRPG